MLQNAGRFRAHLNAALMDMFALTATATPANDAGGKQKEL